MARYLVVSDIERTTQVEVRPTRESAQALMQEKLKKEFLAAGRTKEEWFAIQKLLLYAGQYSDEKFGVGYTYAWSRLDSGVDYDWRIFVLPDEQTEGFLHLVSRPGGVKKNGFNKHNSPRSSS